MRLQEERTKKELNLEEEKCEGPSGHINTKGR
jgi:hypothetical protein